MDENLARAIARLVDRGFDLETLTPEGDATVCRGDERVELRAQDGQVFMRGDVPRDLVRSPADTRRANESARARPAASTVAATGSETSTQQQRIGLVEGFERPRRVQRRRRWWMWSLVLLVLASAAIVGILIALDRPLSDVLSDIGIELSLPPPPLASSPGVDTSPALPHQAAAGGSASLAARCPLTDASRRLRVRLSARHRRAGPQRHALLGSDHPRGHVAKW